jgi:uncharacterized protein YgiM (DUF1202 family)
MRIRIMIGLLLGLFAIMSLAIPLTAQNSNATWAAEFYNTTDFSGPVALSRTDSNIAFDWDRGSPGGSVGQDNFSARWTSTVNFTTSGTYRFTLRADDTARLYLNNSSTTTLAVETDGQTVTADVAITAGNIPMKLEYVERTASAFVFLSWSLLGSGTATTGTPAATAVVPVVYTGWTIQYFAGTTLTGPVLATIPVNSPNFNWGTGSPNTGVPFDQFSARLTKAESFVPGVYRFEVRADDGVRVYVNGQKIIDRWTASDASQTYRADVNITGPSTIFIEYFELSNNASLYYSSVRLPDGSVPSSDAGSINNPGGIISMTAQGTVTAGTLNVREVPSTSGRVLTKVSFGQKYSVVGTNADRSWYQINVAQFTGWVNARFLRISQSSIPVTAPTNFDLAVPNPVIPPAPAVVAPQAASTGYFLNATANLVMHNAPSIQSTRSGLVPLSAAAEILGRNSSNTWWYVTQNLQVGWVSGAYVILPGNMDMSRIPVLQP